jgi:uncharacterized protein
MQPRISMITLGVKDMKKSVAFYEKLGFTRQNEDEDVAFFALNGTWLGLYGYDALAEDAQVSAKGEGFRGFSLAHNVKSEAQVDAVFAEAINAGAAPTKEPQKTFWGGYSSYFQDPDGYMWEVAYNPFFWIGPEDKE